MGSTTAIVVAGGDAVDVDAARRWLPPTGLVVAADSGALEAARLGLHVDVVVGDFDSLPPAALAAAVARGATVERHRPDKDKTDLELALDVALARGADRVVVVAGAGGRLDHAIANVVLLASPAYEAV